MIRWFEHSRVYVPSTILDPCQLNCTFEEVWFQSKDGTRLHGWFIPAPAEGTWRRHTLLLMHGNGGNISHRGAFYEAWHEFGINVLAFDYRGYGQSQGKPSEEGTYLDAQAGYRWLREHGFNPRQIIPIGKSLGGGIASELALREDVGALILQNTFTSIPDIGSEMFPFLPIRRLARIAYDTHSKLPKIHVPVLIAHSPKDQTIGIHHARKNFEAANEPKMFLELAGGHTDTVEAGKVLYLEGLRNFFTKFLQNEEQ
jgi:pimeloyl-ACP methyl ester carboxylesterase